MSDVMNQAIRRRAPDERQQRTEAIRHAASDHDFRDPGDAVRWLAGVDGDAGKLVAQLAAERPYLLGANGQMNSLLRGRGQPAAPAPAEPSQRDRIGGSADGGNAGSPSGWPQLDMNERIRAAARGESMEDYAIDRAKRGEGR